MNLILQCAWVDHKFNSPVVNWNEAFYGKRRRGEPSKEMMAQNEHTRIKVVDYDPPTLTSNIKNGLTFCTSTTPLMAMMSMIHSMHSARINEF